MGLACDSWIIEGLQSGAGSSMLQGPTAMVEECSTCTDPQVSRLNVSIICGIQNSRAGEWGLRGLESGFVLGRVSEGGWCPACLWGVVRGRPRHS